MIDWSKCSTCGFQISRDGHCRNTSCPRFDATPDDPRAEASSLADAEREMWAEDARRDRMRRADEAGRAQAYDAAQARWKGEEE